MSAVERWLRAPRVSDAPGVFAYEHVPRQPDDPDRVTDRRLIGGALLSFLTGVLVWSLLHNGYIPFWREPLTLLTPRDWWNGGGLSRPEAVADNLYSVLWSALLAYYFGRIGNWAEVPRRYLTTPALRAWAALAVGLVIWELSWKGYVPILGAVLPLFPASWIEGGGDKYTAAFVTYTIYAAVALLIAWPCAKYGGWFDLLRGRAGTGPDRPQPRPGTGGAAGAGQPGPSPAEWPELRAAGHHDAAERLTREVTLGRMNDVDCIRIRHAWDLVRATHEGAREFTDTVLRLGGATGVHPSGDRDLPARAAPHDLLTGQVRIGQGVADKRNGYHYRGSGLALDPTLLGTGLLIVGPPGAGKTRQVMRPVAESLCLHALTGQAAVIAVAGADADLGPRESYDVVISPGNPASRYDLDLYGGTADPDQAAWLLAQALVDGPEAEQRRAATALGQLLGPYAAAHGHFPSVPLLRELLDGVEHVYADLRGALDAAGAPALVRELDARQRQSARPGDIGSQLADRIALLDRPAFAGFFDTSGRTRPFSMDALAHPLRVRVELPESGHAEASRILVRLLIAQFTATVLARRDRSQFACLLVDDAGHAVTPGTVRALSSLRSANAGMVLGLRTLDDVPEALRASLVASAGCRMALAGVTPWDGRFFAEAWGTTRVETRDVTRTPDQSGGLPRRLSRGVRRVFTGETVTTESVTVREVERERWSASDLAHTVPAGHAVLSLTTTGGQSAAPVLLDLRA
ncbi:ATP/GTP-binding protein [Streptomyces sp. KK5PA1]|uniref:ATP/GTP-binding protein n=2 Tax=Actinacidiphila acididurans TaxID=2784346 RepID=A0ABS2TKV4_9ACTN|nr:ATP/GTP-binding protein [Actinacidiphila acididurans]